MVFFFKQKSTYEMRISDWSSDVCSSDLLFEIRLLSRVDGAVPAAQHQHRAVQHAGLCHSRHPPELPAARLYRAASGQRRAAMAGHAVARNLCRGLLYLFPRPRQPQRREYSARSEEHTSELQSLMRIS